MQDPIKQPDGRVFTPYIDETLGQYITRDGRDVRISAVAGVFLLGIARGAGGGWIHETWYTDGLFSKIGRCAGLDLMDPPVVETRWFNIYEHNGFISEAAAAVSLIAKHRLACVAVTFTRGDGL
jgi:hypothetical protein